MFFLQTCMQSGVFLIIAGVVVLLIAVLTLVEAFAAVYAQMCLVVAVVLVVFATYVANKRSLTWNLNKHDQIRLDTFVRVNKV